MDRHEIYRQTLTHFLSPIAGALADPSVTEIMILGPEQAYVERQGQLEPVECHFPGTSWLEALAQNIAEFAGRPLDSRNPSLDARLPDGSRVHVMLPPASRRGICITIRRFRHRSFSLQDLCQTGLLTGEAADFLRLAVEFRRNIVLSGGTGTGKTTLLNSLAGTIPERERIIVIEDTSELDLQQPHVVYLEAQPADDNGEGALTIRDLFVSSLRMRPDRILIGEVRRGEALDLIQSMISGHTGSLATVHASTPQDAASRLETLCLSHDAALPLYVARSQVGSALHLVVQIERFRDGSRRITAITECLGIDDRQQYVWNDVFRFEADDQAVPDAVTGSLQWTGSRPSFADSLLQRGYAGSLREGRRLFTKPTSA
ncbi:MAG: CpaF family protein [Planctomycetes bacterium]|nr:CpaF family protein [Planctomycetota bacterium]